MARTPAKSVERTFSRAFDNIVQDEDDVVGLLAYALYKRAIREDAQTGNRTNGDGRNPSKTVVQTYRQAAERTLSEVISSSLEAARPELQASAALDAIESSRANLSEHISRRTGFAQAIFTNVIAWALTLVLTVLILLAFSRPDPVQTLTSAAKGAVGQQKSK